MNPLPPIVGLVAIALGVFAGLQIGAWAAPELPPPTSTTEDDGGGGAAPAEEVSGSDPDSLYHPGPLADALNRLERRFPPGTTVSYVGITPAELRANKVNGPNVLPLKDLPVEAPERILGGVNALREERGQEAVTLDDVTSYGWSTANPTSIEWSIDLDIDTRGPTGYSASRDGSRVTTR